MSVEDGETDRNRKPLRNVQFAKDEAVFATRRLMKVGSLTGRTPDVEAEI